MKERKPMTADLTDMAVVITGAAGIIGSAMAKDFADEPWHNTIQCNLDGAFYFSGRASREMLKQDEGGSILNISSGMGIVPAAGPAIYPEALNSNYPGEYRL